MDWRPHQCEHRTTCDPVTMPLVEEFIHLEMKSTIENDLGIKQESRRTLKGGSERKGTFVMGTLEGCVKGENFLSKHHRENDDLVCATD